MRQIFLDTETTGLSAQNGDRILEVGCVELIDRKLTKNNKHFYINPERDSHEEALKVHGITSEFLSDKPKFAEIAADLVDYLSGAEIIIHNASFDEGFLNKEFELLKLPPLRSFVAKVVDTLAMAKELYPGKRNSLNALCERLGVDNSSRTLHGALLDAELLAEVYICLTRGQNTFLMEQRATDDAGSALTAIDLRTFSLPVLAATSEEQAAHHDVLLQIDKSSGGKTVWSH